MILLSGDVANMPMKYDLPQEETDKYYKDMEAVISSVSSIQSNMYYIPGNVSNDLHIDRTQCLSKAHTGSSQVGTLAWSNICGVKSIYYGMQITL